VDTPIPIRLSPSQGADLIDWLDTAKEGCVLFDARSESSFSDLSDVWVRLKANQKGIAYLGNGWVRADKLLVSEGQVNTLPVVNP
jgi:hypothetical protein